MLLKTGRLWLPARQSSLLGQQENRSKGSETTRTPFKVGEEAHVGRLITTKPGSFAEILFQRSDLVTFRGSSEIVVLVVTRYSVIDGHDYEG